MKISHMKTQEQKNTKDHMSSRIFGTSSSKRETPCAQEPNRKQNHTEDPEHFRERRTAKLKGRGAPTSHLKRPTWTVMGPWSLYTDLVRNLRPKTVVVNCLIILLFSSAVESGQHRRFKSCQVDKCSKDYQSVSKVSDDTGKCRLLLSHRRCLNDLRVSCRGNLLYHTSVHINRQKMEDLHCPILLHNQSTVTTEEPNKNPDTNSCSYARKPKYRFCSLFGDPHVRSFSDKFYTCKANGSWPLIDNDYLEVTATNSMVDGGMDATAISELVVIVKDSGECARRKTYTASVRKPLPDSFDDESQHTGLEQSVKVSEIISGTEIHIDIRFIATTLIVRHVNTHLSFSAQMPAEIVESPIDNRLQMCVRGCPRSQRIPLKRTLSRLTGKKPKSVPKYNEQEARKICKEALLQGNYLTKQSRRSKRDVDGKKLHDSRGLKKNSRRSRNVDMDPAATTWQQLSPGMTGKVRSLRSKNKKRRHGKSGKKKSRNILRAPVLNDEPPRSPKRHGRDKWNRVRDVRKASNFYFEACVFDLMTTGDVVYTSSARGAYEDVTRYHALGQKAPSSSRDVIIKWKPDVTAKPKTTTFETKISIPELGIGASTPSSSATGTQNLDFIALLICLSVSVMFTNFFNVGSILNLNTVFSKTSRVET